MNEIVVDREIHAFIEVLNGSWSAVMRMAGSSGDPSFVDDWLQANWEMIVEASLPPDWVLEPYGDGADCNDSSSRVFRPHAIPNAAVYCVPLDDSVVDGLSSEASVLAPQGAVLDRFVSMVNGWYAAASPFDGALVDTVEGAPQIFGVSRVTFVARKAG